MEPSFRTRKIPARLLSLPLVLLAGTGCGDGGDGGEVDQLSIAFEGVSDGATVSQTVQVKVVAGGAQVSSLRFTAPAELVAIDDNSDPATLAAVWDTTLGKNGNVDIVVEAVVDGATVSDTLTVARANPSASLAANYGDGDYVRNGSSLVLEVTAVPFGATPSIAGVQVRKVSGGGMTTAVPADGVYDGTAGTYDFNLGVPTEGTVEVVANALNSAGEFSEPMVLRLPVLRNDLISFHIPYDFEVTSDGRTGVLLSKMTGNDLLMRLETVGLTDPANPVPGSGATVDLEIGPVNPELAGKPVGNLFLSPAGDKAYVLFPSNLFYSVDLATRSADDLVLTAASARGEGGAGYLHSNRIPYAVMSPSGQYIFAMSSTLSMLVIDAPNHSQVTGEGNSLLLPLSTNPQGFGLMAVHPSSTYVYTVNNWGSYGGGGLTAQVAVYDVANRKFVDSKPTTTTLEVLLIEPANSTFKIAQQPQVSSDGYWLVVPVCDTAMTSTRVRLMDIKSSPGIPTQGTSFDLATAGISGCGTISDISDNGQYVSVVSTDTDNLLAVIDLFTGQILPVTYESGAIDALFTSDNKRVFTENISYTGRSMGLLDLNASPYDVSELSVPSSAGIAPPRDVSDVGYNHLVRSNDFIFQVYTAYTTDATGSLALKGAVMSVYSDAVDGFIFPTASTP